MPPFLFRTFLGALVPLLFLTLRSVSAESELESEINALLSTLDSCKGCVFIRNGSEHSVQEAKSHLLRKYEATKGKIGTVDEFIKALASKSSITGIPYKIRFPDGKEIESEKWLTTQEEKIKKKKNQDRRNVEK
ncbi:hypothetical protein EHO60_06985 [Leptospira fletcheri]|uniref:Uncharacterized protein n=1 Tax=Leptospira fletcheri TaxID=2484981 RepID=A0A4R9GH25_9LEPT|nr:DUF5329 domain-containing protein [Leptospira fletcheri]TGK12010.1 hypothetical protein EHO60_06985 [Leptospira fletcheri]